MVRLIVDVVDGDEKCSSNFKKFLQESARSLLQSGGAGDDLNQLPGDDGLARSVERQRQLLNHLASVLRRVVHGRHPRRLLGARAFLHGVEQQRRHGELQVALDHVGVQRVVQRQLAGRLDRLQAEDRQRRRGVRHHRAELVVDDLAVGELVAAVHDLVGDLGGVQELWRQASDLRECYAMINSKLVMDLAG